MIEDYTKEFNDNLINKNSLLIAREEENSFMNEMLSGSFAGSLSQNSDIFGSNVLIAKKRFNTLFTRFVFIGSKNDGLTEVPGTGGTIARNLLTTTFVGGSDSTCSVYSAEFSSGGTAMDEISWGYSHEFLVSAGVYGANATYDIFLGAYGTQSDPIPDNATSVVRHIGFFIYDDLVYASNADGTTQTKTQITGLTLDDFNTYRYEFITNLEIKFYVNDIFVAKHTTNLPSGTDSQDPGILIGVEGQGAAKSLHISNNYSVLITI